MSKLPSSIMMLALAAFALIFITAVDDSSALNDETFTIGDITYTISSETENTVSVSDGTGCSGDVMIPENVSYSSKNYSVTAISKRAFYDNSSILSVSIPDTVVTISDEAFCDCEGISTLTIGKSVTTIGPNTFTRCRGLSTIYFNAVNCSDPSDTSYWLNAYGIFTYCFSTKDMNLIFGDDVERIPAKLFRTQFGQLQYKINSITVPDNVRSIGTYAFYNCNNITSVSLGNSVSSIEDYAFDYCTGLSQFAVSSGNETFCSENGILYSKDMKILVHFPMGSAYTSFSVPNSIEKIGAKAFLRCPVISITISENVRTIGSEAFSKCSKMSTITVGKNVSTIGDNAFSDCNQLYSIVNYSLLDITMGSTDYGEIGRYAKSITGSVSEYQDDICKYKYNALSFVASLVSCVGSPVDLTIDTVSINDNSYNIISIETKAFQNCTSLKSVVIGNNVTKVGDYTFASCTSLETAVLSNRLLTIPGYMFYYCTSLSSIIIPDGVTLIDSLSFYNCTSLNSIAIPDSVKTINSSAFSGCSSLETVDLGSGVEILDSNVFYSCKSLMSIIIPDSVTTIGGSVFGGCTELQSVNIGSNVATIGSSAFYDCKSLASVAIPKNVTSIGTYAFGGCDAITEFTVSSENGSYSSENGILFDKAKTTLIKYPAGKADTNYDIPGSVTAIDENAFNNAIHLKNILLNGHLTTIGYRAFYNCCALVSIDIPDSVTTVSSNIFENCFELGSVNIGSGLKTISYGMFSNCTSLKTISVPDNVETIENYAFSCCSALTSIDIGSGVTSIKDILFNGCSSLKNINVSDENSKYSSSNGVLFNKNGSTLIKYPAGKTESEYTVPESVMAIDQYAFYCCDSIVSIEISKNVSNIDEFSVCSCHSFSEYIVSSENSDFSSYNGVLFNKMGTILIQYPCNRSDYSYSIPNTVSIIKGYAFYNCSQLFTINIPKNIQTIESYAFVTCYHLVEICNDSALDIVKGEQSENGGIARYCTHIYSSDSGTSFVKTMVLQDLSLLAYLESDEGISLITIVSENTDLVLPDKINDKTYSICSHAFYERDDLNTLYIGRYVTSLNNAFCYSFYDEDGKTYLNETPENLAGLTFTRDNYKMIRPPVWNLSYSDPNTPYVLHSRPYVKGSEITSIDHTVTKDPDCRYTYTHNGWAYMNGEKVVFPFTITSDTQICPTFSTTAIPYMINFFDYDGTLIESQTYEYGAHINAPTPTRESTSEYSYKFKYWTNSDGSYANVNNIYENMTVYASYTESKISTNGTVDVTTVIIVIVVIVALIGVAVLISKRKKKI